MLLKSICPFKTQSLKLEYFPHQDYFTTQVSLDNIFSAFHSNWVCTEVNKYINDAHFVF